MTVLFIVLGILLVIGGFSCIFTPLLTFMDMGYFVVILISVFGIVGIINGIVKKQLGINLVFSILSVLLGITMLSFPQYLLLGEGVMLMMTAIWFVVMGVITIVNSIRITKAAGSGIWVLQLIFGILAVIVGVSSFYEPLRLAVTIGVLIGIEFIEAGLTLIFMR